MGHAQAKSVIYWECILTQQKIKPMLIECLLKLQVKIYLVYPIAIYINLKKTHA